MLSRLLFILDRARDERIIVDVTFTAEHIGGMTASGARNEIVATAAALKPYRNVLIDIQNERNIYGPGGRGLAANDVASILAGIKAIDPDRIVTASNSPIETDASTAAARCHDMLCTPMMYWERARPRRSASLRSNDAKGLGMPPDRHRQQSESAACDPRHNTVSRSQP